jgi:FkbM family methyltransferase
MFKSRLIYDYKPFNRKKMIRFYRNFLGQGDLCFDIGAHTGNRTATWLRLGARVVAVEPQPAYIRLLEKKFSKCPEFSLEKKAVGRIPGKAILYISRMNPAISTLSDEWKTVLVDFDPSVAWEDKVETEVISLDEMVTRYGLPVFCKIDVEGYEEEVLEGLSLPLPALSFEFFPTTLYRTVQCIQILEKLGNYRYNWALTESFRLKSSSWVEADEIVSAMESYAGRKSGDIYARMSS